MNSTADIQLFRKSLQFLNDLFESNEHDEKIIKSLQETAINFDTVSAEVHRFDYQDIKSNGFRLALYVVARYLQKCTHLASNKQFNDVQMIVDFSNWWLVQTVKCLNASNGSKLRSLTSEQLKIFMDEYFNMEDTLVQIIGHSAGLQYDDSVKQMYQYFPDYIAAVTATTWSSLIKMALNTEYRRKALVQNLLGSNYTMQVKTFRFFDKWVWMNMYLKLKFPYYDIETKDIHVTLKSKFEYIVNGSEIELQLNDIKIETGRKIMFRIYSTKSSNTTFKNVVFFSHSGAAIALGLDVHDTALVKMAQNLGPDSAVICIDYRLAPEHRYPAGLQDILDAYHWLTSSTDNDLKEALSFVPANVLIVGESIGGNYLAAVLITLADIKRKWPSEQSARYPCGFVSINSAFSVELTNSYPSLLMATVDPLMNIWTCFSVLAGAYCPVVSSPIKFESSEQFTESPGFKAFKTIERHPYVSPLFYNSFEELKSIPLSIVTFSTCPFHDYSIIMAKKWSGPVAFKVFPDLPHSFLLFATICKSAFEALHDCIGECKRLLNDADS